MGFGKANAEKAKGFVPSTDADLKRYRKAGRKAQETKKNGKRKLKEKRATGKRAVDGEAAIELLEKHLPVRIYRTEMFERMISCFKDADVKPPAYRDYLEARDADAQFMFDMQAALSRLSWHHLARIVGAALRVPVPMRHWSEAYHWCVILVVQAFDVQDYLDRKKSFKGDTKIKDRDALDEWPIPAMQRRPKGAKEEKMGDSKRFRNGKLKAGKADADDEEEEEEEVEEGDEDEGEEEEEEEEEAPKK